MAGSRLLTIWLLFFGAVLSVLGQNSITFSFTIAGTQDTVTSAAVLDSNGIIVRTLWGNKSYPPGSYTQTWDGNLDGGATSTPGATYTIKVLTNNVNYNYDGHLGTTDAQWYTSHRYGGLCSWYGGLAAKIVFAGNKGWVGCGYNEGTPNVLTFDKNTPNYPNVPYPMYFTTQHFTNDLATDNHWVYLMEVPQQGTTGQHYFVTAVDANSTMPVYFSQGTLDSTSFVWVNTAAGGTSIPGTYIDNSVVPATDVPTGIAVQRNSNILAVAHATTGTIHLFDKISGASIGTVTGVHVPTIWTTFTPMAFTSEGLWIISDGQLYLITGLPSSPVITQPITGFSFASAVGANTLTNSLFVADGGTKQQVYEYAVNTHTLMRTLGVLGGYNDCNPTITNNRLMLDDVPVFGVNVSNSTTNNYFRYVFVQADDDDNVWIEDLQGARIQHFDANSNYINRIVSRRPSYFAVVSETMPTRLFIGPYEYAINYNVPLLPGDPDPALGGNGSWTFSKDWLVCALGAGGSPPLTTGQDKYAWEGVEQFSNGRVYGELYGHPGGTGFRNFFELPANGTSPARNTGVLAINGASLARNGDQILSNSTGSAPAKTVTSFKYPLTGFDGSNNPIYGSSVAIITTTTNAANVNAVPSGGVIGIASGEPSTSGYYPVFATNASNIARAPHAAAMKTGFSTYAWATMPEVNMFYAPDFLGDFPQNMTGNQGSGVIKTEGTNFFFLLAGNFDPRGSQIYHYYEDGMLIGQFGNTQSFPGAVQPLQTPPGRYSLQYPLPPGQFGNTLYFSTTTYNGDVYVYVGDEGNTPSHRWHISNLGSVHEFTGTTILQPNGSVTLARLF